MSESAVRSDRVPRAVGAAAEAVLGARGEIRRLKRIFEQSHVPMVMVDGSRRYVEVNRPARLAFRISLDEMRMYVIDDLTPPHLIRVMKGAWARLIDTGCVAGRYQVAGPDGSRLDIVYYGLAQPLPGLHLIAFAPADWPDGELDMIEHDVSDRSASLTPRELEVLSRAADGLTGPELARELWVSPTTVNTHFKNIYEKLDARNRAAAVANAMRLGLIS
jgi:DNA-binding CsgD family transcriptional regulator